MRKIRENLAPGIKKKHTIFIVLALWVIFIDFPSFSSNSLAPQQVHKVLIRDIFLDNQLDMLCQIHDKLNGKLKVKQQK